jgi:hypothetical protein
MPNGTQRRNTLIALALAALTPVIAAGQTLAPDINAYMATVQIEPHKGEIFFGSAVNELGELRFSIPVALPVGSEQRRRRQQHRCREIVDLLGKLSLAERFH